MTLLADRAEPESPESRDWLDRLLAGDIRTGARLMRDLDDRRPEVCVDPTSPFSGGA